MRKHFHRVAAALLVCTAAALSEGCDEQLADPSLQNLRLTGDISRNVIPPGGTATLTFRLENISDDSVALRFTTSCQVLPYIATRPAGFIVYPAGGQWTCTAEVSELILRPAAAITRDVTVQSTGLATDPAPGNVGLLPGEYSAYARLDVTGIDIQSIPVLFVVQ